MSSMPAHGEQKDRLRNDSSMCLPLMRRPLGKGGRTAVHTVGASQYLPARDDRRSRDSVTDPMGDGGQPEAAR
jgi:hypothetical protein